jgi:hypothetical protein
MSSSEYLSKAWFWYIFIAFVIVVLFIYGSNLNTVKTEVQQMKVQIDSLNQEISVRDTTLMEKNGAIISKSSQIKDLEQLRKILRDSIIQLKDSILKLKAIKPEVITKYQDRPVYLKRPEPYHQYGKGYGRLVIYSVCGNGNLKIWVDGVYEGTLDKYYTRDPGCSASIAVAKITLAGKHHIQAQDGQGRNWDTYTTVIEDYCKPMPLSCPN